MNSTWSLRLSVAVLSAAVVVYEITLTRLFSFLLHYHFTFLVVSGAICGLGVGAAIAFFIKPTGERTAAWMASVAQWMALYIVVSAGVLSMVSGLSPWLLALVAGLPIVLAGLFLTWVFSAHRYESSALYFFDLAGAALGTLLVIPSLEWFGGPGALLAAAVLTLLAALLVQWSGLRAVCTLAAVAALVLQVGTPWLTMELRAPRGTPAKPMVRAIDGGAKPVVSQWSAYARTDLVDRSGETGLNFYVDGGAGSYMFRFNGDFRRLFFLRREAAFLPYYFGPRERTLIVGPGGGQDVLYALMTGWRHVEGVEVNPQIVSLVRQYGDYNGHIFNREGVDIHIGDGRHYLERSEHQYDLIALPLVYAEAADLVGYALLENYLFTREAFQAYIDHLQPQGRLALVVHNHALMTRALATLADGWTDRPGGTGSVLDHVLVVNGTRANRSQAEAQRPLVLVQKAPYTDAQIRELRAVIDELDLQLYYAPRFLEHPRLRSLRSGSVEDFVGAQTGDISPVSDARPFFYDVSRGLDEKLNVVLWYAAIACLSVLIVPVAYALSRGRSAEATPFVLACYATLLGAGFMMMEMYLLQRLAPFLGYPTLTLVAALFGLLMAVGLGSLMSERLAMVHSLRGLGLFTVLTAILCALYSGPLDGLISAADGWSIEARGAFVLVAVGMPGVAMGVLFPSALRLSSGALSVPWMWASNGFASVLGSAAAVALAMEWSVAHASFAAGAAYGLAGVVLLTFRRSAQISVPMRRALHLKRGVLPVVLCIALVWFAAFSFVADRYWQAPSGPTWPRLPVAEQIWPQAMRR